MVLVKKSTKGLGKRTILYIDRIIDILAEFKMPLTIRQIYYQFRALGYFKDINEKAETTLWETEEEKTKWIVKQLGKRYKWVMDACKIGRKRELISWKRIRDTSRPEYKYYSFDDLEAWVKEVKDFDVHLNHWKDSKYYLEVWTEKDAMTNIIKPIADKWRLSFYVTKGFQSLTGLWKAEKRKKFLLQIVDKKTKILKKRKVIIIYLGDFDPSGLCIDESIKNFFKERNVDIEFERICLTKKQAMALELMPEPCNPADKRTKKFIEKYGNKAWELDAISPNRFPMYIENEINKIVEKYADFDPADADEKDDEVTEEFSDLIQDIIDEKGWSD